jgi:molecular chaperone GrpE
MIEEKMENTNGREGHEEVEKAGEPFTPEVSPEDLAKGTSSGSEDSPEQIKKDLEKSQKEYLYLFSEFENYKKRTLKERMELLKSASQDIMVAMLPVLDDFERALRSLEESENTGPEVLEGVELIFNKVSSVLEQKGLRKMKSVGEEFNTDFHEAITKVPAADESQVNMVVDEAECGYMLNDKVIRHAKVVVAG